jgi:hypothetical protein
VCVSVRECMCVYVRAFVCVCVTSATSPKQPMAMLRSFAGLGGSVELVVLEVVIGLAE